MPASTTTAAGHISTGWPGLASGGDSKTSRGGPLFAVAPPELREREARLLKSPDLVFTGGRSLYEAKAGRNPNVHLFPSAVEADHFARALDGATPVPDDLARLPRPVLGYYGVVDERLDYDLIAANAKSIQFDEEEVKMVLELYQTDERLPELNQRTVADELVRRANVLSSAKVTFIEDSTLL